MPMGLGLEPGSAALPVGARPRVSTRASAADFLDGFRFSLQTQDERFGMEAGHMSFLMVPNTRSAATALLALLAAASGCSAGTAGGGSSLDAGAAGAGCGDGVVSASEACDTAIAQGLIGACPTSCDDAVACTTDLPLGEDCSQSCTHSEITACVTGDGCCPAGCDAPKDADCSTTCGNATLEPGEACDTAIAAGQPGACPTSCEDNAACTNDKLVGAGCSAECSHTAIASCSAGDGCCPSGCDASTDADCSATCGNGYVESGEVCDTAIATGQPGACPTSCEDDATCTKDTLVGAGCSAECTHIEIHSCTAGDGCCPAGCEVSTDADCSATCGNGSLEPGEACDTAIASGQPGACPTSCSDGEACTADKLVGAGCSAQCSHAAVSECLAGDGCCPSECNEYSDTDCPPTCGNGVVDWNEACDTAIASGHPGACPTACDDADSCTSNFLDSSGGPCQSHCVFNPVYSCDAWWSDGCCPSGCTANTDVDCSATCGNGSVESGETCDTAIPQNTSGACPATCDDGLGCTVDHWVGAGCTVSCAHDFIDACGPADGCCPFLCNPGLDSDCQAACGNAYLDPGETCDVAIAAGMPGSCPTSCKDGDQCTKDTLNGALTCLAECKFTPITACANGDGCCPSGCTYSSDHDCACVPTVSCDALKQTCNTIADDGCGSPIVCGPPCGTWGNAAGYQFGGGIYRFAMDRSGPDRVLLHGGLVSSTQAVDNTQEYDAQADTWTSYNTGGVRPQPRHGHSMAYAGGGRLVMAGGTHVADTETWEYDANSHTWIPIPNAGGPVTGVLGMSYAGSGKVVGVGGGTWMYETTTHMWTMLSSDFHPPAMAWTGHGTVLAVGGDVAELFDPTTKTWTDISSTSPAACIHRIETRLAYAGGSLVVLFGGRNGSESFQPTIGNACAYNATTNSWTQLTTPAEIVGRNQHGFAFAGRGRALLMGGYSYPTATLSERIRGDAWIFYSGLFSTDAMP